MLPLCLFRFSSLSSFTASCNDVKDTSGHWKTSFSLLFFFFFIIFSFSSSFGICCRFCLICHLSCENRTGQFFVRIFLAHLEYISSRLWYWKTEGHWNNPWDADMYVNLNRSYYYIENKSSLSLVIKFDSFILLLLKFMTSGKVQARILIWNDWK